MSKLPKQQRRFIFRLSFFIPILEVMLINISKFIINASVVFLS